MATALRPKGHIKHFTFVFALGNKAVNKYWYLPICSFFRFPSFSLHGIQKSSPLSTCSEIEKLEETSLHADTVNKEKLNSFFNDYKDIEQDTILACGIERLCVDLDVNPTDFIVLALAWKFNAATMCKFTRLVSVLL